MRVFGNTELVSTATSYLQVSLQKIAAFVNMWGFYDLKRLLTVTWMDFWFQVTRSPFDLIWLTIISFRDISTISLCYEKKIFTKLTSSRDLWYFLNIFPLVSHLSCVALLSLYFLSPISFQTWRCCRSCSRLARFVVVQHSLTTPQWDFYQEDEDFQTLP